MSDKQGNGGNGKEGRRELQAVEVGLYAATKNKWSSLEEAEEAFKKSRDFHEYSLLINAVAAWQIAEYKLYEPKFNSLNQYLMESKNRLGVSRGYFFERVRMAEAFVRYGQQLRDAGFRENRDVSNLRLFFQAVEAHGEEQAIERLPKLSYRDYQRWINGTLIEDDTDVGAEPEGVEVDSRGIRYRGELIVSTRKIAKIYQSGEEPYVVGVRSDSEKRALSRWLNDRRRKEKGGE